MTQPLTVIGMALLMALSAAAQDDQDKPIPEPTYVTDWKDPALAELAQPLEPDLSQYGAGPLTEPGKTFYVSVNGDDKAAGTSWNTAWRTVRRGVNRLTAGDTLLIGEGEHFIDQTIWINLLRSRIPQVGEPGKPIRIMAAPRQRAVLTGAALFADLVRAPGTRYTYVTDCDRSAIRTAWESNSLIQLQDAGALARVDELPGTYCLDTTNRKLYVRFADSGGPQGRGVRVMTTDNAFYVASNHVHIKDLIFKHFIDAIMISSHADYKSLQAPPELNGPLGGEHNTVENCQLLSCDTRGMRLTTLASWNLIKDNVGKRNGLRSNIGMQKTRDNLIIGNRLYGADRSLRTHAVRYGGAFENYGAWGERNHIINNLLMDDNLSVLWKPASKQSVFQGNVVPGGIACTGTVALANGDPAMRIIVRNNILCQSISWQMKGETLGPGGPGADWAGVDKAFVNNFYASSLTKAVQTARFADPEHEDFRLQSDSPLIGKGVGGFDRGAVSKDLGRILYVGPTGDDAKAGTSQLLALRTLERAAAELRPGDTLYIIPGQYDQPLHVKADSTEDQPIRVRAFGRGTVVLPGVVVAAPHTIVSGLTVRGASGSGIAIEAPSVTLEYCVVEGSSAAGVSAHAAPGLSLRHCTLVNNDAGLTLAGGSVDASIRDSVVAGNRSAATNIAADSANGYLASHNCYWGAGIDSTSLADAFGSVVGDPLFVDGAGHDYRLQWNSPAATRTPDGEPAGAFPVMPRQLQLANLRIKVSAIRHDSAAVLWETPLDDTTGRISYRPKGEQKWQAVAAPDQGTVLLAGLTGLKPGTEYEYQVIGRGRRGGEFSSDIATFTTLAEARAPSVYYVAPDGDDLADGLSRQEAWRTIRRACLEAGPGDTVRVLPGVYVHAIAPAASGESDRRITFERYGEGAVVLDAGRSIAPLVAIYDRHYITVDGFTLTNLPPEGRVGAVELKRANGIEILNCRTDKIAWKSGNCITTVDCDNLRVEGNVFWGAGYQLAFWTTSNALIKGNTLVDATFYHVMIWKQSNIRLVNNLMAHPNMPGKNNAACLLRGDTSGFSSDHNLYYSPDPKDSVGEIKDLANVFLHKCDLLSQWKQATGYDAHSVQADPLFADYKAGDFRLRPESPAVGAGEHGAVIGALGVMK